MGWLIVQGNIQEGLLFKRQENCIVLSFFKDKGKEKRKKYIFQQFVLALSSGSGLCREYYPLVIDYVGMHLGFIIKLTHFNSS